MTTGWCGAAVPTETGGWGLALGSRASHASRRAWKRLGLCTSSFSFLSFFLSFLNVMQSKFKDHIAVFISASQLYYPSLILFNIDFRRNNRRFHLLPMASKADDVKSKQTWADQATAEWQRPHLACVCHKHFAHLHAPYSLTHNLHLSLELAQSDGQATHIHRTGYFATKPAVVHTRNHHSTNKFSQQMVCHLPNRSSSLI